MLPHHRSVPWAAVVLGMVFPTIVTLAYFVLLAGWPASWQQIVYLIGKTIQFSFPVLAVAMVAARRREGGSSPAKTGRLSLWAVLRRKLRRARLRVVQLTRPRSRWFRRHSRFLALSAGFGLLVLAAMFGLYEAFWKNGELFAGAARSIRGKIADLGIERLWLYVAVGVFYAICHSGLEEYYWRWFVFGQLRFRLPLASAIAIASLAFMTHHVILLATYFGWLSPWTYGFSLAVAAGGAVWAWLYERSGSLTGPWLSHMIVDAAIFLVGYDVARDLIV